MIPKQVIDEILARTDIGQLISKYVTLQRAGSNLRGLCPFHSEKTPSFTVFGGQQSFYCFGCGVGGDAITFVRKAENLDYVGAVEYLAKAAGITVPDQQDDLRGQPRYDKKRLLEMNVAAARYFHACLKGSSPGAREAYQYLNGRRGLSGATISHFGLGYAPRESGVFVQHMTGLGYTVDELVVGNLCGRDDKTGRIYTSFYNRVMFPIIDVSGNVIAFGGRVMDNSVPKYKNSSDTPIYNKRRNVYALNFAKDACSEEIILCEGYMDVIALHAAGFTNAIATLGTAITPEHARLMHRYTKRVVIAYDMDSAGRAAADKAMRMLEEVGLEVRLVRLEDAKDPDEFIKKFGKDRFRSALEASHSKFDYNMWRVLSKYSLAVPQEKIQAANELCEIISGFYSAAERDVYIQTVAKRLEMDPRALKKDVDRLVQKRAREQQKKVRQDARQSSLGFSDRVNPDYVRMPAVAHSEEAVLGMLMLHPEHLALVRKGEIALTEEDFLTAFNRKVFLAVLSDENGTPDQADFSAEDYGRIVKMKIDRMSLTDNGRIVFEECVKNLKETANKQRQSGDATPDALQDLLNSLRSNPADSNV